MKRHITLSAILAFPILIFGQIELTEGPIIKPKGKMCNIIGSNEKTFYTLRNDGEYYIDGYSKENLNQEFSKLIPDLDEESYYSSHFINGKILLLTVRRERDTVTISAQFIDNQGLLAPKTLLAKVPKATGKGLYIPFAQNYFSTALSPNGKKLLVTTYHYHDEILERRIYIFDTENLNLKWKSETKIEIGNECKIDNNENVYSIDNLLNIYIYNQNSSRNITTNLKIKPSAIDAKAIMGKYSSTFVLFKKQNFMNVQFDVQDDSIIVTGFFNDGNAGIYVIKASISSGKAVSKNFYFQEKDKNKLFSTSGAPTILWAKNLKKINNEYYLIGEEVSYLVASDHYTTSETRSIPTAGGGTMNTTNTSTHNSTQVFPKYYSTIVCKINVKGDMVWSNFLPKKIITGLDRIYQTIEENFIAEVDKDFLHIYQYTNPTDINGNLHVFNMNDMNYIRNVGQTQISDFKINSLGEIQQSSFGDKQFNMQPNIPGSRNLPTNVFYKYDNTLILFFNTKKQEHFATLNFK